jgi:N-acetyl-anhydromuramyl-L-alanine amidase AmpD
MMDIDKTKYKLTFQNYVKEKTEKTQILLTNSFREIDKHFAKLRYRNLGKNKKTPHFSIDRSGNVFQHFNPEFYSDILGDKNIDRQIITISLINRGWLDKDVLNNRYFDYIGDLYHHGDIYERMWRNHGYWDSYSNEQIISCAKLSKYLCDKFNINQNFIQDNIKIPGIENFKGIVSRSNYSAFYTDISPAFNSDFFEDNLN